MKIVICGTGVIGMSCAYMLSWLGHDIVCIDSYKDIAMGTSRINGGLLCPGLTQPWTHNPNLFIKSLFQKTPAITVGATNFINPLFWNWSYHWFRNINVDTSNAIGSLSNYSMTCFDKKPFSEIQYKDYDRTAKGTIMMNNQIYKNDSSGDILKFCKKIRENCPDIKFILDSPVNEICVEDNKVIGLKTDDGIISGDIYILATGIGTTKLCKSININVPIYPVKGQILTFKSATKCENNLELPNKTFLSPLNNVYRASGFVDFESPSLLNLSGDYDKIDMKRNKQLETIIAKKFEDYVILNRSYGFRPLSPDDVPYIGKAEPYENLYVCAGHGSKGWTMAPGSAMLLNDIIFGNETIIDTSPYNVNRFSLNYKNGVK